MITNQATIASENKMKFSTIINELSQETLALTRRLFIQLIRRPFTLVAGIVQPLMWLVLFGALFSNAPKNLLPDNANYGQFMGAGIVVFTAFSGALNAGLPVMFDREFGFLNRLLVAPLRSRSSIVIASILYITSLSLLQSAVILIVSAKLGYGWPGFAGLVLIFIVLSLLVFAVTAISLGMAFLLPGHIEMIAVIFVTNLPLLFASTALAPISFMPVWLKWFASINPLTFAIEPIRAAYAGQVALSKVVLIAPYGSITIFHCLMILVTITLLLSLLMRPLLDRKLS
ncbi:putative multidrug efflux ABC transporter (chromatophore) [Paulinella micropora]|uniref:Multidrug efflux ABC transporter n=1 Tax=Paulinella micropora TaxID=1928728 RepID=A0A1S6YIZ3_9EUKA|nr:putative multidrug efflux ABC transporter [Paulinella micropora]BBL86483.1 putative multidrug efflux ABC transporter [Paulinella micropora]